MWVLRTELGTSARGMSSFDFCAVFRALPQHLFKNLISFYIKAIVMVSSYILDWSQKNYVSWDNPSLFFCKFMCTCLLVCLCSTCALSAYGSHRRPSDPLELKLLRLLATMSMLRTEPGLSRRVASDLQHYAITPNMGMNNFCLCELSILLLFARAY